MPPRAAGAATPRAAADYERVRGGRTVQNAGAGRAAGFASVYPLLLPLGGYRDYRAYVVRYDTALPLTLGLLAFAGGTALYLLRHLPTPAARRGYALGVGAVALVFAIADRRLTLRPIENNAAERAALSRLAAAPDGPVPLPPGTRVLAWAPITDPAASVVNAALLAHWRITARPTLYYSAPEPALPPGH